MHVVALLSGGKDSCFSILRSRQHGHRVVALAHITPPRGEADSFMFQSVGAAAVPHIAAALRLPLFARPTRARARERRLFYTPTERDEVEDLVALLRTVKRHCPSVQAVCSGALWSDYQRLRVESAVSRVGLLSLSYLWRRNQTQLLDEMIDAGVHAVLVKVAAMGLNSHHLGKTLHQMRPTLHQLERKYGSHVCGEGGEFESLVLWMPGFEKRLVLEHTHVVPHSHDPYAPVSYLAITSCRLDELTDEQLQTPAPQPIVAPQLFRPSTDWRHIIQRCDSSTNSPDNANVQDTQLPLRVSVGCGNTFLIVSIQSPQDGSKGVTEAAVQLKRVLHKYDESLASVLYVTLSLRCVSGSSYKQANAGYNELFAVPECTPPPSRACVAVSPANHATTLEALVRRKRNRDAPGAFTLHVQSLSEWAPPCIGPYAQLVEEDGIVHVSGVLPLYAPSAKVPDDFVGRAQVEACVYNLEKTLEASHSSIQKMGLFVAYTTSDCLVVHVQEALNAELSIRGKEDSLIVVLPIAALPKDALVEVRAVGVVNEDDLHFVEHEQAVDESQYDTVHMVSCGTLGYAVSTRKHVGSIDDLDMGLKSMLSNPFGSAGKLLSIQLYYSEAFYTSDVETLLRKRAPGAALTLTKCHEPCMEASTKSIAVYDLS